MQTLTPDVKDYEYKTNTDAYYIKLKLDSNHIEISIKKNVLLNGKKYLKIYTLEELKMQSKWFRMFDSIQEAYQEITIFFQNQTIKLREETNFIGLILPIPIKSSEEIIFPILETESKQEIVLSEICDMVNNLSKTVFSLMKKFEVIEKTPEYQRLFNKKTAINNGEILLKKDEEELIKKSIICGENEELSFELIYKASIDGDSNENFHHCCDNKGANIVMIKTKKGLVFGGYSSVSWDKSDKYKSDGNAFLFSITMKKIYSIKEIHEAVYCDSYAGPVFGIGHDIYISGGHFLSSSDNTCSLKTYSNGYQTELNGKETRFVVDELEVYQVITKPIIKE